MVASIAGKSAIRELIMAIPCQSCIWLDRKAGLRPMKIYLTAPLAFAPHAAISNGVVVVETESGTIVSVGGRDAVEIPARAKHFDYPDVVLAPGFIDLHIHGGCGHDVMEG